MILPYKKHITYLFWIAFLLSSRLTAQEKGLILSKYYSPKEYRAGTQNWAITQDKRGVMYFGNTAGILEYDGVNWNTIPVSNNSAIRCLDIDTNNIMYVGAFGQMGYLAPDNYGKLSYLSLNHLINHEYIDFGEVWDVNTFADTVYFLTDKFLFRYHNKSFDYWKSEKERFYLSFKVNNAYYVQEMGKGLLRFGNNALNLISEGEFFADKRIHAIFQVGKKLIICTRTEGFFLYDFSGDQVIIKSFNELSDKPKNVNNYFLKHSFYHGIELGDSLFAMSTVLGDVLIIDHNWNVVDVINYETVGIKSANHFLYYQKNHSLWLALANGISQIEINSPFRYWNDEKGINGTLSDVASLDNKLYVATGSGVFYVNKESDLINFELNNFFPVDGTFEQSWSFLYFQPPYSISDNKKFSGYIPTKHSKLLVATSRGLFHIDGSKSQQISSFRGVLKIYQYKKDPSKVFVGFGTGVGLLNYKNDSWQQLGKKYGIYDNIRDICEDSLGNIWLSASYKGLYKITDPLNENSATHKIELYDTTKGIPSIASVRIYEDGNQLFFESDNKLVRYNYSENLFEEFNYKEIQDSTFNSDQTMDTLYEYRIMDELPTNYYISSLDDTTYWFGTTRGTFKYQGKTKRDYFDLSPALIRKVVTGDSTIFFGTNFKKNKFLSDSGLISNFLNPNPNVNIGSVLSYKNNSLTFYFAMPFYEDESKNTYSCFLDGYDKDWSSWNNETKRVYTNLPEGEYVFNVKSKNLYQIESKIASFQFEILPPWYRTLWAYLGYVVISVLFVIVVVKIYTYRLIKEKENLERIVKERTQEILMQNEEIMVQAEHLKDANEWISAKNIELENQKEEIEKKKDQLEISNATKNKFFRIIAHDLRNPISTFLNSTAYILTDIEDFSKEKTKTFISELNRLSQTTYNLLENLLDWSTSQMGEIKFNPKTFDIVGVIKENVELIKNKLDSKKITLNLSLPEKVDVFADENMINTVVRNLISNAAKFTHEKGEISISCTNDDKLCFVTISDNGIGISKENIDKLFRIDQHHTTPGTQNEKGSGLGLILCKEFVEQNGGTITVTSEYGKSSTFSFSLNIS
jgi:signal transduction histidine kinase